MQVILGLLYHFIGGAASGSFYIPYSKVKKWSWESYWIVGGIFSWLLVPPLGAWLTAPGYTEVLANAESSTLLYTYMMGLLWGIGGLTFGLSMRYLGMSLGMAIALGLCSAFGTLIPPIFYEIFGSQGNEKTITEIFSTTSGQVTLFGVFLCLVGIAICGKAGIMKEKEMPDEQKKESIKEFNFSKGILVATFSGILSAFMAFGYATGKPIAEATVASGIDPLWQNNPVLVVILLGGLTSNFIWCVYLNFRNKTGSDYTNPQTPLLRNYFFSAVAGITWYLQFFFYGMGESLFAESGVGFTSWTLHMAFIIIISNLWGIYLKEWKGASKKTMFAIVLGISTVILSTVVVGYGNYLAE
ncbi:L-rhamnose/proton symporter RhaT [Pontibacter beigongshangensis]|uniref:L-rhamnose/proton symporter RhaT n=1 Tax=Pontibacter beigongshangensis TaxID=2574733 RepID=UPI00164F7B16|nr:L-rhamnose/proton symporter RhaT [Pontibacter beigongshangensis]